MRLPVHPILLAALCLAPVPGWSQARTETSSKPAHLPLVAIMPLKTQGIDENSSAIVTDALGTEILRTGAFRVMERSQMDRILKEQGFQQSGACDGAECAVEMGKLLAIDRMVVGSVGKLGSSWTVSARLVDVATGEVLGSSMRMKQGDIEVVATDLLPPLVRDLVVGTKGNAPAPTPVVATAPVPAPTPVATPAPVTRPQPAAEPSPSHEDNPPEIDPATGWKKRKFRLALGGSLAYVGATANTSSTSSDVAVSTESGGGIDFDVRGLWTVHDRLELGAGLGFGGIGFALKFDTSALLASSSGKQIDGFRYDVTVVTTDLSLYAGWKVLPKLTVGAEYLLRVPVGGTAKLSATHSGETVGSTIDQPVELASSTITQEQYDSTFYVHRISYLGLRVAWQPLYRLLLDASIRASLNGVLADYEADGSGSYKLKDAVRTDNVTLTEFALGVHFLF
jgi:hypothetical protein